MNDREKSHGPIVPARLRNKAAEAAADGVEGRGPTKEKPNGQNADRTQSRADAQSALERVRQAARRNKRMKFAALLHHLTYGRLEAAYRRLKRDAAPGVDGVRWSEYGEGLREKLEDLLGRVHRGAYRAKPSRRTYIPKGDGGQRPLGIATIEDKIVQSAMAEVLNAIYEEDFFGFCYGFRVRKSQHHALDALAVAIMRKKVNWVLDADIRGFFDSISHEWMRKFIEHRIGDERVVRLIQKWLSAGVMEQGEWSWSESGTPQGAAILPLLANVYLYHVLDKWVHAWRKRYARGEVIIVRYADDFVMGFEHREDAERFKVELGERLRKFDLELNAEKTRLIEFGRYAARHREGKPETFTFLGFTHICGTTRKGLFALHRRTDPRRMRRKLHEVAVELRRRRHDPVPEQGRWLQSVIRGYYAYHAVPNNIDAPEAFGKGVLRLWQQSLRRRSQKDRTTQKRMQRLRDCWFPAPRIQHPWPERRFDVRIQGRNRMR
jgi:group II intron reverse transcriptase/maturase